MLRVAVVGSGPSGVFTAQALVQQQTVPGVTVDVLDRLPCPYGLVRYGVAPDHEKIKSLQNTLRTALEHPGVTFLGNVRVGEEPGALAPQRLLELYHAVVYCVGAAADRRLGIPGEDLPGSFSATEFVSWYSAHPDAAPRGFGLGARSAVVIGVGNVAVDVARLLARGADELRRTDVPDAALEALAGSRVTDVHMVGRRGPAQAKFTTKELRELGALTGVQALVRDEEAALDPAWADPSALPSAVRRNVEVLRGWAGQPEQEEGRRIRLRFFLRPVALLGDGAVEAVRFERTEPDGHGGVVGTGRHEEIAAQLVLRSVGYRGVPVPGLPFDVRNGTVPHVRGRVLRDGTPAPGEYVAGWIKRGPTGVIGTNRPCAKETVASLLADAEALLARRPSGDAQSALRAAGQEPVEWPGWLGIEAAEAALGQRLGRGTVKIPDWAGLLAAARDGR
ncbi:MULTISPECIES: FAD-dependent oxidoreductase [Streptomyces]|uniref:ferredoxin--NADP(+) reductase n=1 Tax=Streptomyces morookaense TaxID=1970 RepID=A0A7Y7B280_STRMO|nr:MULTISPECIES: FAD-dependent oxidoreductase [Streptomyces]MCC2277954.1 FAD-dependent oxidoreductase [Streptomyces sp. ET3-23]NVK77545.1 FAD-dependent oxidoreductase [Streptomyces morookaense]GHF22388.1 NADP oxidoreductase [Streptomyces morookaense]